MSISRSKVFWGSLFIASSVLTAQAVNQQPVDVMAARVTTGQLHVKSSINTYIAQQGFQTPVITEELHKFEMFPYKTSDGLPNGIVFHQTDDKNSFRAREGADYEINYGWQTAFVHTFIDDKTILNIHDTDYGCWGAGPKANARFVQFELVTARDRAGFAKSINNAAWYTAYLAKYYGIPLTLARYNYGLGGIWTHADVSKFLGGTDHTDPDAYLAKWHYTLNEFLDLVKIYANDPSMPAPRGPLQGKKEVVDKYVTVTHTSYPVYSGFDWHVKQPISNLYQNTYHVTGQYHHKNGSTYLSLYDQNGAWQGYINANGVANASGTQGAWMKASEYATLTQAGQPIYRDFSGKASGSTTGEVGQTFKVTGQYHTFAGVRYLSLYRQNGQWLGYVKPESVSVSQGAQGAWQNKNGYLKLTSKNYTIWSSFDFKRGTSTGKYSALTVKGMYHHANGSLYYSVYDVKGKWIGYVNANAGTFVTSAQGAKIAADRYVTVTHTGYPVYSGFDWHIKQPISNLYDKTYHVTGEYHHLNGSTYLSLYDAAGAWQGYINANGVSNAAGPQGVWLKANKYVTLTQQNQPLYLDWSGQTAATTTAEYGNTFKATGEYHAFDGNVYLSLYRQNGQWLGYVKQSAASVSNNPQGAWQAQGGFLQGVSPNYTIWSSFSFAHGISSKGHSSLKINGMYHHANGSVYYSVYTTSGQWLGYLNAKAGTLSTSGGQLQTSQLTTAQQTFVSQVASAVVPVADANNLYASVMAAQAIEETGWGTSVLSQQAHNYFGIKADDGWTGQTMTVTSPEVVDGKTVQLAGTFRKYNSLADSAKDYAAKVRKGTTYQGTWRENAKDGLAAVDGLGSWATDPSYRTALKGLITKYNLTALDYE